MCDILDTSKAVPIKRSSRRKITIKQSSSNQKEQRQQKNDSLRIKAQIATNYSNITNYAGTNHMRSVESVLKAGPNASRIGNKSACESLQSLGKVELSSGESTPIKMPKIKIKDIKSNQRLPRETR